MAYWMALFLSDSQQNHPPSQRMQRTKRTKRSTRKPRQMIPHLLPMGISPFTVTVTCVCPEAASQDPRRTSYFIVMTAQVHTGMAVLSRTNSVTMRLCGLRSRPAWVSPALETNCHNTHQDLSPTGLKRPPYRPQGTATSPQPSWEQHSNLHNAREDLTKEDLPLSQHIKWFCFCISFGLHCKFLVLQCRKNVFSVCHFWFLFSPDQVAPKSSPLTSKRSQLWSQKWHNTF